jgi:hypothetical protein
MKYLKVSDAIHDRLRIIAAIRGLTIQQVVDEYLIKATAKAYKRAFSKEAKAEAGAP